MTLRVSNTLSGEREEFEPADPDNVLLYYCGLTVSDYAHLGHARTWVHVDVIHRWLEALGYDVRHVENITDVNEKIVARVGEPADGDTFGDDEGDVATHFIDQLLSDMRSLNLKRAEVYPRVSEHVPEIIDLIETLVERGYAYESNGSVYFDVTEFEEYGKLSNQRLEAVEAQGPETEQAEKRHPADFALWKAGGVSESALEEHRDADCEYATESPAGQTWASPWGEGRPGWHIECSAMSMTHLDDSIDIHMGGRDLVFPHHENEIAQSEAATGEQFARYWLHADLFQMDDEKMSSSLGNFIPVSEAVARFGVNPLRMFFLSASYNSTQTYSEAAIEEALERWDRLAAAYERAAAAADSPAAGTKVDSPLGEAVEAAEAAFTEAMNDDFNTREALSALFDLASAINSHLDDRDRYDYRALRRGIEAFERLGGDVLGFDFDGSADGEAALAGELVELLLEVREAEREAENYERADKIRDDIEALGVEIQDTDDGAEYRL
ncbi:cysteine--tRNA ligase [Natronomonas pharaonis DSM 2160]|uniref:Cysteine--tRNA ligase n=1 Tax=Natronomonas pharaonis (strain ATCC 35678 / DSM 2160 / CIP 103997 / JCM 8858 / NBRC 14720 / NCIMB 2260 / Gabara) TaxID=348780 RepID=A0A1U7EYK1_NATPD|nr:cysteine--tRNA ligase [Natronomonas pharaonis]CAI50311.1 cysteine--tRNA ligase [Natronomonas pharaonis DSM 2160]